MNHTRFAVPTLSLFVLALLLTNCTTREEREKAERIRLWELDSVREARTQDSLLVINFPHRLSAMRRALRDSLELRGSDCMRFSVMFGWPTEVGPCMSLSPCKEGGSYVLYVNAFNWRNHDDFDRISEKKEITATDFARFSAIMDSVEFDNLSIVPLPDSLFDYTVFDGEDFVIERRKAGVYHGIARYTPADLFIYDLLATGSYLAGLPKSAGDGFRAGKVNAERILERRRQNFLD